VPSRRARIAAFAGLGASAALASTAGLAWWQRCAVAEWLAVRELRARGVAAELRVSRLDLRGAEIADVRLGAAEAPDLALAHASASWSWEGLRAGRLEGVALRGLRVRARVDEAGVHLGALDALLASGEPDAVGAPLALPFLEASLEDAQATLESPQGALRLTASGSARPEGELVRAELVLHGESPQGALDFGGGATLQRDTQEVAAIGTLAGVTPWGSAEGLLRAQGTLAALRADFSGSVEPDARALSVSASEPVRVNGGATRDAAGAIDAELSVAASGVAAEDVAELASALASARLRSDAKGLAAEGTYSAVGVRLEGFGTSVRVAGEATLRAQRIETQAALEDVELPDLVRAPRAALRGSYDLESGAATLHVEAQQALAPELARIVGLTADVTLDGERLSGDIRAKQVIELSQPALVAPLRVAVKLSGGVERVLLQGTAATPGDGLAFALDGTLRPESGQLELKIALPETDVSPKTRQPARVFPWLSAIQAMRGKVGLEALASLAGDRFGASSVIALNGADVVTEWGTIRGLMGVVTATDLDPLETPPGQTVWMQSVDAGLPLGAGTLKFQLTPDGVLRAERGEWGFAGGTLSFAGPIPFEASERTLALQVDGVSVEQLLAALDFEGLAGNGVLGGVAPIVQRGDEMLVRGAELKATETGVIRFTSGEGAARLARTQPALAPLLGALEDFHYDELTLTMNGDLADRVEAKLHLRGKNPKFQQGRPVVLNVNVDLPLASLLRAASVATGVPEQIEEQVQRAMGKEKP
jgi:hypothetical protein